MSVRYVHIWLHLKKKNVVCASEQISATTKKYELAVNKANIDYIHESNSFRLYHNRSKDRRKKNYSFDQYWSNEWNNSNIINLKNKNYYIQKEKKNKQTMKFNQTSRYNKKLFRISFVRIFHKYLFSLFQTTLCTQTKTISCITLVLDKYCVQLCQQFFVFLWRILRFRYNQFLPVHLQ